MPKYRVIIHPREMAEEESNLPFSFNVNDRTVTFVPGEEIVISETALENLKKRAIYEKSVVKDGEIVGKKMVERYQTTVLETIYSDEEKEAMKPKKKVAA
jgi:hypothetical protein